MGATSPLAPSGFLLAWCPKVKPLALPASLPTDPREIQFLQPGRWEKPVTCLCLSQNPACMASSFLAAFYQA
jgi:hypothetical protein